MSQLAVQMARELGLGSEDTIKTLPTEHEQNDLRQTWWAVVTLDILSSFCTFATLYLFLFLYLECTWN